jgi:hypothetical protein
VLSFETISGLISTGRAVTQESRTAATIIRSRDTTTIVSQLGSTPTTERVT